MIRPWTAPDRTDGEWCSGGTGKAPLGIDTSLAA